MSNVAIVIEQGCSRSTVLGLNVDEVARVKEALTYTDQSVSYQISQTFKRLRFHQKKGHDEAVEVFSRRLEELKTQLRVCLVQEIAQGIVVPSGLIQRLREMLNESVEVRDLRVKPVTKRGWPFQYPAGRFPQLRPYQSEQFQALLAAGQGTIESATGTGKTVVIKKIIQHLGLKSLVIVPSLPLVDQTASNFIDFFGRNRVAKYGGKHKGKGDITVACAPSILSSSPRDWDDVDVLVFDECHHLPCDTVGKICYEFAPNAYYRFGFTATAFRADGADLAIEGGAFPILHHYTVQQAIADGWLAVPRFVVCRVTSSPNANRFSNHVRAFQEHVAKNPKVVDLATQQILACLKKEKQVLVLVKEREQGHVLAERIPGSVFVRAKEPKPKKKKGRGPDVLDLPLAPFMEPWRAIEDFNRGKLRCLIGTSVIGEGSDILPVDVLVLLTGGASRGLVTQNLGRALRKIPGRKESVLILDYAVDVPQAPAIKRHAELRQELYRSLGEIKVLEK